MLLGTPKLGFAQMSSTTDDLVLRSGTQEVLLDFTVRDKHHKLIGDIRSQEVEIYEDGVKQSIRSFSFRDHEALIKADAVRAVGPAHSASDSVRDFNFVTLVFEGISQSNLGTARELAHDFLKSATGPNTWLAVYSISDQFVVSQSLTSDVQLISQAVDKALAHSNSHLSQSTLDIAERLNGTRQATGASGSNGGNTEAANLASMGQRGMPNLGGGDPIAYQPLDPGSAEELGPASRSTEQGFTTQNDEALLESQFRQSGFRSIDVLRQLVKAQAMLPGRKTVILFSEGVVVPPDQPDLLDEIITQANRSDISFYTIDARGLSVVSNLRLSEAISSHIGQADMGTAPAVLATDLQANARVLAEHTGGFAMDNSNDLRGSLSQVAKQIHSHYVATFTPSDTSVDGHFHKLEVRILRRGLTAQSRDGYFALPVESGGEVTSSKLLALHALDSNPLPHQFAYSSAALRFGTDVDGINYRIVFAIPTTSLNIVEDKAKLSFRLSVFVLGFVKDENNQIVAMVSHRLPFQGPANKLQQFNLGKVTVVLPARLKPGRYHLETVAVDENTGRTSVKRAVLLVPGSAAKEKSLRLSDLVWVRNIAEGELSDKASALQSKQGEIIPDIDPSPWPSSDIGFYLRIYPVSGIETKPTLCLTVLHEDRVLITKDLDLPTLGADGTYEVIGSVALSTLEPGDYAVLITAKQGGEQAQEEGSFALIAKK